MLNEYTETNDGGDALPNIYVMHGSKIIELCGMQSAQQVLTLAELELSAARADDKLLLVATLATENQRT